MYVISPAQPAYAHLATEKIGPISMPRRSPRDEGFHSEPIISRSSKCRIVFYGYNKLIYDMFNGRLVYLINSIYTRTRNCSKFSILRNKVRRDATNKARDDEIIDLSNCFFTKNGSD